MSCSKWNNRKTYKLVNFVKPCQWASSSISTQQIDPKRRFNVDLRKVQNFEPKISENFPRRDFVANCKSFLSLFETLLTFEVEYWRYCNSLCLCREAELVSNQKDPKTVQVILHYLLRKIEHFAIPRNLKFWTYFSPFVCVVLLRDGLREMDPRIVQS